TVTASRVVASACSPPPPSCPALPESCSAMAGSASASNDAQHRLRRQAMRIWTMRLLPGNRTICKRLPSAWPIMPDPRSGCRIGACGGCGVNPAEVRPHHQRQPGSPASPRGIEHSRSAETYFRLRNGTFVPDKLGGRNQRIAAEHGRQAPARQLLVPGRDAHIDAISNPDDITRSSRQLHQWTCRYAGSGRPRKQMDSSPVAPEMGQTRKRYDPVWHFEDAVAVVGYDCVGRSIRLPERHFPAPLTLILANERPAKRGKALLWLDFAQEFGLGLPSVGKRGIAGRLA